MIFFEIKEIRESFLCINSAYYFHFLRLILAKQRKKKLQNEHHINQNIATGKMGKELKKKEISRKEFIYIKTVLT